MKKSLIIIACLISGILSGQTIDKSKVVFIKYNPDKETSGKTGSILPLNDNQASGTDVTLKAASGWWLTFIQDSAITEDYINGIWKNKTKAEYTYYPNAGTLERSAEFTWNSDEDKWDVYYKVETYYNSNNRVDSLLRYYYPDMNSSYKYEYEYNENGRQVSGIFSRWDVIEGQWKLDSKAEQFYDSRGNITKDIRSDWDDSSNSWVSTTKYEYSFYAQSRTSSAYFIKNTDDSWYCSQKEEYRYDSIGNPIQTIYYSWMNTDLDTSRIVNIQYNDNGWPILETQFRRNVSTGEWITIKSEYTYLGNRQSYKISSYTLDQITQNWILNATVEYISNTKVNNSESFYWDSWFDVWRGSGKYERFRNEQGLDTLYISYKWDYDTKQWYAQYQTQYFYDYDGFKDIALSLQNNNIETAAKWDTVSRTTNYYSIYKTSVPELQIKETKVYPNPADGYIMVDMKDNGQQYSVFELYDINGRIVLQSKIRDGNRLPVTKLQDGIYIYNIYQGNTASRGKIIIKH
jgi:hypothetical protein